MGTDDGRAGGSSVVDTNAKVYGTDNLFVVDASVFPGMVTGNPSAAIVILAERAFERINALRAPRPGASGAQCGGSTWTGSFHCAAGLECVYQDATTSKVRPADPYTYKTVFPSTEAVQLIRILYSASDLPPTPLLRPTPRRRRRRPWSRRPVLSYRPFLCP